MLILDHEFPDWFKRCYYRFLWNFKALTSIIWCFQWIDFRQHLPSLLALHDTTCMDVHHCFATTSGSTMTVNTTGLCGWFRPIHAGIGAKKRSNMASNSYFISLLVWFTFLWVSDFLYIAWLECWSLFTNYHPCLTICVKPVETATNHGFPNAALCSSDETG